MELSARPISPSPDSRGNINVWTLSQRPMYISSATARRPNIIRDCSNTAVVHRTPSLHCPQWIDLSIIFACMSTLFDSILFSILFFPPSQITELHTDLQHTCYPRYFSDNRLITVNWIETVLHVFKNV
jgi:hypothetical protein